MTTDVVMMRTRVLDAFRTKEPKGDLFMPLCFFDYFADMPGYTDADDELDYRAKFSEGLDAVFMDWCGGGAYRVETDSSVKVSTEVDGSTSVETFQTPVGSVHQVWERRLDLNAAFIVEPMLRSEDDLRVYRYLVEAETIVPTPDAVQKWLDTVGGRGVAMQPGCDVPFHRLMYSFGPERFLLMAMDGLSAEVKGVFAVIHAKGLDKARAMANSPIQVVNHQASWDIG
ncbi:MAG: hypothetical protein KAU28_05235, partial [Phycisphaerae bacterium]|nr:hypothetical protein [Phycisphaerae bacterium]